MLFFAVEVLPNLAYLSMRHAAPRLSRSAALLLIKFLLLASIVVQKRFPNSRLPPTLAALAHRLST